MSIYIRYRQLNLIVFFQQDQEGNEHLHHDQEGHEHLHYDQEGHMTKAHDQEGHEHLHYEHLH